MPTSPNSLTKIAQRSVAGLSASNCLMSVVLPVPKKPVMMLVGIAEDCGANIIGYFSV